MRLSPRHVVAPSFAGWIALAVVAHAQAEITSVKPQTPAVAKYAKVELSVGTTATYKNPYDPDEADLSAEFTAPSKKVWKVNGFFDGANWKVRFAANEPGTWQYVVSLKDAAGTSKTAVQSFECADSKLHGWVRVAPNQRYLAHDDGASFYGVGACHAWSVTANSLDQMKALGFNTYVYWNGTYDQNGGNALIESMASGLGRYDQRKCARLDQLFDWTESRDMTMVLVLLPHDYAGENINGWPSKWSLNPYQSIVTSGNYYSDQTSWAYQEKQYRYIIARWGYSRGLCSWQTVDEISGTNGWRADQAGANAWTAKIAEYFQTHDPFKHPTTASHGDFWDAGNKANDLANTEIYRNYATGNLVSTIQRLWNGYEKPCIMGETGAERDGAGAHRKLWSCLAAGIAVTPLLWQFNEGWNPAISAQYAPFNRFIADINFAALQKPAQAKVSIPGLPDSEPVATRGNRGGRGTIPADNGVWAITSQSLTFGWMTGAISGKSLRVDNLAPGAYKLEWWDSTAGKILSTQTASPTNGTLTAEIPATDQTEMAFKIIGPAP